MTTIPGDPVAHTLETDQLFGGDVDHVAGALPLVALHWLLGLQVPESAKPQGVHHPPDSGEGRLEGLGDSAERAALVALIHGLLQLLRIDVASASAAEPPWRYRASHL
jgi:hypothetical protein